MTAAPALIAPVAPTKDEPVLLALTTWAAEAIWPARLLQGGLKFLLGSVELNKLGQRQAGLELDSIHSHDNDDQYIRASPSTKSCLRSLLPNQVENCPFSRNFSDII